MAGIEAAHRLSLNELAIIAPRYRAMSAFQPILLQKSFWGYERKFSELLKRPKPRDVRDHIISYKNDHRSSYRP